MLNRKSSLLYYKTSGFTLIELIVVIILLGILAVNIVPKFFTSTGFEDVGYRNEVVTKLRAIQLRAMQQTDGTQCHHIKLNSATQELGLLQTDATQSNNCALSTFECTNNSAAGTCTTSIRIESDHDVTLAINDVDGDFWFDQMGRPKDCAGSPCQITIAGEGTFTVQIESEGYIRAL